VSFVLSASRRTDIPAFYVPWLLRRMAAGTVSWKNPFGRGTFSVSLEPDDVDAWVFWSKNPRPLLEQALPVLRERYGDRFLLTFTITGLADGPTRPVLEPHVPRVDEACELFLRWADAMGGDPRRLSWRLDPVVAADQSPPERQLEAAARIAERLRGATRTCIFSFVDNYGKVKRNFARIGAEHGWRFREMSAAEQIEFARRLVAILEPNGIEARSCCEPVVEGVPGVRRSACVDGALVAEIWPERAGRLDRKAAPSREACACTLSRDIGAYDSCIHGCPYCYANGRHDKALAGFRAHREEGETLLPLG
jgi:hypothetical protein